MACFVHPHAACGLRPVCPVWLWQRAMPHVPCPIVCQRPPVRPLPGVASLCALLLLLLVTAAVHKVNPGAASQSCGCFPSLLCCCFYFPFAFLCLIEFCELAGAAVLEEVPIKGCLGYLQVVVSFESMLPLNEFFTINQGLKASYRQPCARPCQSCLWSSKFVSGWKCVCKRFR